MVHTSDDGGGSRRRKARASKKSALSKKSICGLHKILTARPQSGSLEKFVPRHSHDAGGICYFRTLSVRIGIEGRTEWNGCFPARHGRDTANRGAAFPASGAPARVIGHPQVSSFVKIWTGYVRD